MIGLVDSNDLRVVLVVDLNNGIDSDESVVIWNDVRNFRREIAATTQRMGETANGNISSSAKMRIQQVVEVPHDCISIEQGIKVNPLPRVSSENDKDHNESQMHGNQQAVKIGAAHWMKDATIFFGAAGQRARQRREEPARSVHPEMGLHGSIERGDGGGHRGREEARAGAWGSTTGVDRTREPRHVYGDYPQNPRHPPQDITRYNRYAQA
ncbi:hypothetical protein C8R44DRAFT_901493 [Mycena epipterygia]|nr:hypothetical protein C8R44DRAFT_901493 [Mycena epipterygia]